MDLITVNVIDFDGSLKPLEVPTGINLSLMEAMKASGYEIEASCGGMALCATCHVDVIVGHDQLSAANDAELEMLDMLPVLKPNSRLSCQIRINDEVDGITVQILG